MKSKLSIITLSLGLFLLVSCEKEKNYVDNASAGSPNEVGYGLPSGNAIILNIDAASAEIDTTLNVFLSSKSSNGSAIGVTIDTDTASINAYNDANSTEYEEMPSDVYTYPASITIPAGSNTGEAHLKIDVQKLLSKGLSFAVGFKITNVNANGVSIQSAHNSAVVIVRVKNKYDGVYTMDGTMQDVVNPGLTGWYPIDMQLITYTSNSVALYDGINYVDAYGHPIKNGSAGSYYGSFSPVFYFDANGKITSVTNYYGQYSGGNQRAAVLDPTGVNKATFKDDGSIEKFEVSYIMTQSVSSPDAPRTYFKEKFVYKGAR